MTILDDENFDSLPEGQSPPNGWIYVGTGTCEVDDAQYVSSPHSMLVIGAAASYARKEYAPGYTSEPLYFKFRTTGRTTNIYTQETTGVKDGAKQAMSLYFISGSTIWYFDGAWWDTGVPWMINTWYDLKVVHNVVSDTFDLWLDTIQIVTGGGLLNAVTAIRAFHLQPEPARIIWIDDYQIGDAAPPSGHGLLLSSNRNKIAGVV